MEYRLVKIINYQGNDEIQIRMVYYHDNGEIKWIDSEPPYGNTKEEVNHCLEEMKKAFKKSIIDFRE